VGDDGGGAVSCLSWIAMLWTTLTSWQNGKCVRSDEQAKAALLIIKQ